jgi:hypothetical protein
MRNQYRIVDYSELGLPCIEVYGGQFHYQDLYEIIGCNHYMTTFQLKADSESYEEFGPTVLGIIHYDSKSLKALESSLVNGTEIAETRVRIDSADRDHALQQKCDLKYHGLKIADIGHIAFFPYKKESKKYETGEKKVPDVVEIKSDCSGVDVDMLNQNYLASKINSGTKLIQYEKEHFIGIMLGLNEGCIDSRILKHLGFDEDDFKKNLYIWNQMYQVKERRGQLSAVDEKDYREIKSILSLEKMLKGVKELALSGINSWEGESTKIILREIFESINAFTPSILLHGKNQVFWDIDSYIHIALRHVKDYQVGNYKNKTPFSYKPKDLESLIEKVLWQVADELKQHLSQESGNDFTRHGKMAIFYNGDHYHLHINGEGRLIQFHMV